MSLTIAIVGKGGTGKTTLCGALARAFDTFGRKVLAVDADPDANLASVLPLAVGVTPIPLAKQKQRIHKVLDPDGKLPPPFSVLNPNVSKLTLGWHKSGGEGCYCEKSNDFAI